MNQTVRLIAHALLGAALGLFTAGVFWMIYLFQEFDMPVPQSLRLRSALLITVIILLIVGIVMIRKRIYATLNKAYAVEEEDDDSSE